MTLRLPTSRRATPLLGVALFALAVFVGGASAGAPEYPSPLFLSGAGLPSTILASSYQLVASAGVGATTRPTPTAVICGACGAGNLNLGAGPSVTYFYRYTLVDSTSGTETAPSLSVSVSSVLNAQVTVGNLPTGVTVRLYRAKGSGTLFNKIAELTSNASSTFTDNVTDAAAGAGPVLPQAQNRAAAFTGTGWFDFSPGNYVTTPGLTTAFASTAAPVSPAYGFNGKGWILDGAGSVAFPAGSFPAGSWAITVKITSVGTGTARLGIGMWVVDGTGARVGSPLIDPSCSSSPCASGAQPGLNMTVNIGPTATNTVTSTFASMPAFSLAAMQHLYVQFFRDQTATSTGNPIETLDTYDGIAKITHPAADSLPTYPTLQTPANAASTNSSTLVAAFNDPDAGDTGTVDFRVCSAAAAAGVQCSPLVANGTSTSVANGANASWTISPTIADGSYDWQARGTDATGGQSGWSATRTFTLDTVAPDTTISASPSSPTNATGASFGFTASKPGSTFQCQLDGGGYTSCTSPKSYSGLADGSHTFQVKATDPAGNTTSPVTSTWTIDTVAPDTSISAGPASPTNATGATFSFAATKTGSTFRCQLDDGASTPCASPQSYSGLADGNHTFQVTATDPAGNTDPTSASFTFAVDTTPPGLPDAVGPPGERTTSLQLEVTFRDSTRLGSGTITFRLCPDPSCATTIATGTSSVLENGGSATLTMSNGLPDGAYFWQVMADDALGNGTAWTTAKALTLDRTPPAQPSLFGGTVAEGALTLHWAPPAGDDSIASYVLYVDGVRWLAIDGSSRKFAVGAFGADDARNFALAAIDAAGNMGPQTEELAGVPDLVGLRLSEAIAALDARGLVLGGKRALSVGNGGALVVAQKPAPGLRLAPVRTPVFVELSSPSGAVGRPPAANGGSRLVIHVAGARTVSCVGRGRLTFRTELSRAANVAVRFLSVAGVPLGSTRFSRVPAGAREIHVPLPSGFSEGRRYRMVVTASTSGQIVRTEFELTISRPAPRTTAHSESCGS